MARLNRMPEPMRSHLAKLPCPSFEDQPWVSGESLSHRRVALISTAGLQRRGDRPFEGMSGDYRVILKAVKERCLKEEDKSLLLIGTLLLMPMDQA